MTNFKVNDEVIVHGSHGKIVSTYENAKGLWCTIEFSTNVDTYLSSDVKLKSLILKEVPIFQLNEIIYSPDGKHKITDIDEDNETYDMVSLERITVSFKEAHIRYAKW